MKSLSVRKTMDWILLCASVNNYADSLLLMVMTLLAIVKVKNI